MSTPKRDDLQPPNDLSDMPCDPRWRWVDGIGWYIPPAAPGWVGISTMKLRNRQELDWWRAYRNAAEGVAELERRLRALGQTEQLRLL